VKGNPDLIPSNTHSINTAMYYWNQASFANVGFNIDAGVTNDPIIYTQQSVFEEGKGIVNITRPVNMDQSRQIESWVWTNLPIIKTKLTLYFNGGLSFDESPASINSITDQSNTASARFGGGINLTPGTKLVLSTGFWENFTQVKYDLNNNFNQKYFNYSLYGSVKWQFVKRMFLESNFNYNYYRNKNYSFEQSIPLWNASVRRILGKNNKFELRLAAFDIFNKNVSLSQTAYANYIQKSTTNTLARYFMLSITYNMKGFESKLEKNRFW
jgi:hypothetical protein